MTHRRNDTRKEYDIEVRLSLLEGDADVAETERDDLAKTMRIEAEKTRAAIARLTGAAITAAFSFATAAVVVAIQTIVG